MGFQRLHLSYFPYYAESLSGVDYVQTVNLVYFAHLDYPLQRLTRNDHTDWEIAEVTFGTSISPPANVTATPTQPNSTDAVDASYTYYVTTIDENGQESRASTPDSADNDLSLQGNYNTITWDAVAGAAFYVVYKGDNFAPGYIGVVEGGVTSFKDRNLIPVAAQTPPTAENPFAAADDYPSTIAFFQRRLIAGRTRNRLNAVWGSKTEDFENMDKAHVTRPDDALAFALVGEKVNSVNQLVPMKKELMALTSDGIYSITGGEGGALTPSAIEPERETARGASRRDPIAVDSVIFYEPSKSKGVRAIGYTFEIDGYRSNDVSIFSPHFFKNHTIVDWAYQESPYSCIWVVRDDGILLCFTWEEEQQVWGWTLCETDGFVERVAVITEDGTDRLYALIRRTINGVERRFHERLALPHTDDPVEACHLDCAVTQITEEASNIIDGLWHLEGETVSAVYDGWVVHDLVVENGRVTLPQEAYVRTAGLRYSGLIETLPAALTSNQGSAHVNRQIIGEVTMRAIDTRGLEASTDGSTFDPFPERDGPDPHLLPDGGLRDFKLVPEGNWNDGATLSIRQEEPLPAHIVALFVEIEASEG